MLSKIRHTLQKYIDTNIDVLDTRKIAEIQAQMDFTYYLEKDHLSDEVKAKDSKITRLQQLLFKVMRQKNMNKGNREDVKVTRREFIDIYNEAQHYLIDDNTGEVREDSPVYNSNVTVHWAGIYCDCSDGATAWNAIISNIQTVIDEDGDD